MEAKLTIVLQPSPVVKQGWTQQSFSELNLTYQLPPEDGWIDIPHPENLMCDLSLDRNSGDQFICIKALESSSGGRRESFCQKLFGYLDFDKCVSYFCSVQEVRVGNRDVLKIHFCSGGSDDGTYYVLTNQGKTIVISDYAALYPWIKNKPKIPWEELRDEIISTFWFD